MIIIYLTGLVGYESRSSVTGVVLVFAEVVAKMWAGVAVIGGLNWA